MSAQTRSVQQVPSFSFKKYWWIPFALLFLLVAGLEVWYNILAQTALAPVAQETLEMTGEFSGGSFVFHCTPDPNSTAERPRSFWTFTGNFFNGTSVNSNGGGAPHNGVCPPGEEQANELFEFFFSLIRGDAKLSSTYSGDALFEVAWELVQIIIGF